MARPMPGPAARPVARLLDAVEALEHAVEVVGRDAVAGVRRSTRGHRRVGARRRRSPCRPSACSARRSTAGWRGPGQAGRGRRGRGASPARSVREGQPGALDRWRLRAPGRSRSATARSSSTSCGGLLAGVALGQGIERARQPDQSIGFLVERLVGRPVGGDHAVAQRLEVALQVGQRRAQLVGGVGDEVAPHLLLALQAGGHLVERVGQAGQLLGAVARDPRGVVPVGDPARGRADLARAAGRASGRARWRCRCWRGPPRPTRR